MSRRYVKIMKDGFDCVGRSRYDDDDDWFVGVVSDGAGV